MSDQLFPDPPVTTREVLDELHRELNMRLSVFPKWVKDGRLTQRAADHRIECIAKAIEIIGEDT